MGGSPGVSAEKATGRGADSGNVSLAKIQQQSDLQNNPAIQQIMQDYGSGKVDLATALSNIPGATEGDKAIHRQALSTLIATNPMAATKFATEQTMNNPMLSGLFGKDGLSSKAQDQYGTASKNIDEDREALKGRDESYGLKASDLAAYGQASGNIGRMFANQEQTLAQKLANRGLAAAPSGVANLSYSNLYGNQNEQLAQAQQSIAQNRINTAKDLANSRMNASLQRQAQAGNLASQLGDLGNRAIGDQFGRNMAGVENQYNRDAGAAGMDMQNQGLQQNINNEKFNQIQATKEDDFGTKMGKAASSGLAKLISDPIGTVGKVVGLGGGGGK